MSRPRIICHMLTALDGKITGDFMNTAACGAAGEAYEATNDSYHPDAWLCGRVTTDENFTFYAEPELDPAAPPPPAGDFVAVGDAAMYYVSVDPKGRIGWKSDILRYADRPAAHVIELLTEEAPDAYRAFLRKLGISYIVAGSGAIDCALAAEKLHDLFGIRTLMVSGGGFINWTFLAAGLVDELSVILAPVADGANDTVTLFEKPRSLADTPPVEFSLKAARILTGDVLWLRYAVRGR
ncbi:RibD family protein [Sutterella sp.]|uniref:RibD family protein n=1 Tax=Sutterella sp. TaxID=1981025 RepID=UPI0026E0D676|nr:RibD family protein [Sutterella sp.]MDO5532754.1 RibD family protein [Sutterella sp.]